VAVVTVALVWNLKKLLIVADIN